MSNHPSSVTGLNIAMINNPIENSIPNVDTYISCLVENNTNRIIKYENDNDENVIQRVQDNM